MRRLIITNTYYQLLTAIQMKNTLFHNDELVLLISNQSNNADIVAHNLIATGIFNEVHFISSKNLIYNRSKINKILDGIRIGFGLKNSFSFYLDNIHNLNFDEIIVYNLGVDIYSVFSELYRYNSEIAVSVMEEGILSYDMGTLGTNNWRYINALRKLLGHKIFTAALIRFYCFYPEVYRGNLISVHIPRIQTDSISVKQMMTVFDVGKMRLQYTSKFILFTSVYDFEGGEPVGEYELACRIADLVGKDNLLIKQHPRDIRNIYVDNGFHVDSNSSIPWEVIQLSANICDVTYLTINSGSVLCSSTLSIKPTRTIFLYRLCDYSRNTSCQKSVLRIEEMLNDEKMKMIYKNVQVAGVLEDIL